MRPQKSAAIADNDHFTWPDLIQRIETLRNMGKNVIDIVGFRSHQQNSNSSLTEILLIPQSFVDSKENIEFPLCHR